MYPGGDGTPGFAEFAPAELGAVLGISTGSAGFLMCDGLDLRHRLPLLWARLLAGEVRCWVARRVASRTRDLTQETAGVVDRKIAPLADTVVFARLERVLEAAVLSADPERAAAETGGCQMVCVRGRSYRRDHDGHCDY